MENVLVALLGIIRTVSPGDGYYGVPPLMRIIKLLWPTAPSRYLVNRQVRRHFLGITRSPPDDAPDTAPHHTPAATSDCASAGLPAPSHAPAPPPAHHWCHTPIRQQILRCNPVNQLLRRRAIRHRPRRYRHPTPGAACCSASFGAPNGLITAHRARAVLIHLDMTGINHQPLKARVIGHRSQQFAPPVVLPPTPIAACGGVPVSVVRGQVAQGAPVLRLQNTVLMKWRLSSAGPPTLPGPPERCGAMVSQA